MLKLGLGLGLFGHGMSGLGDDDSFTGAYLFPDGSHFYAFPDGSHYYSQP